MFDAIPNKTPASYFVDLHKQILNVIRKGRRMTMAKKKKKY
jgi:hypothetical protein